MLTALVDTDLSHCFNSLSNSTIGRLTENYIHDFVHIVFPKLQSQNDSYYEVVLVIVLYEFILFSRYYMSVYKIWLLKRLAASLKQLC